MSKKNVSGKFVAKRRGLHKGIIAKAALPVVLLAVILLTALLTAVLATLLGDGKKTASGNSSAPSGTLSNDEMSSAWNGEVVSAVENTVNLGYGIYVTNIGGYTGAYMEDGSDEILSGILMLAVRNDSSQDIQYAEITMDFGETQGCFQLTTLPAGRSMILLEKSRLPWDATFDYTTVLPVADNVAYFQMPLSLQEEKLQIQIVDGALNVTNISQEDIPGTVKVYYKNAVEDLLYGGITYQVTIDGGLAAGQIRQIMTKHASDAGSKIMFVTIAQ